MKNEDKHIEFSEQIIRYLSAEMSDAEKERFELLLEEDADKKAEFLEHEKLWKGVDSVVEQSRYDMDAEWSLLEGKIDFESLNLGPDRHRDDGKLGHERHRDDGKIGPDRHRDDGDDDQGRVRTLRTTFMRIAAAVLIGMAGIAAWLVIDNARSFEQVALEQGTEVIELPDGSVITLNAGSELKYAVNEYADERKVILSGEAFFEVARDTMRPFRIEAGSTVVEVLGTSFNVKAYDDNETVEVMVNTGLVSMASIKDEEKQIILNPGNKGVFNKEEKSLDIIKKADPNTFAWKTMELSFSDTPLSEVLSVINHAYQVDIALSNSGLNDCPLTVSFDKQELSSVLNVICNTLDLEMSKQDGTLILSGEPCE